MTKEMEQLQKNLGYKFKSPLLLENALTHSSYANEKGTGLDNERLEFLGDSVLGFITAEYLFEHYKNFPYFHYIVFRNIYSPLLLLKYDML